MTHLFSKFRVQPVLDCPWEMKGFPGVLWLEVPTVAFCLFNIGPDLVSASEIFVRKFAPQFGHEILDRVAFKVQRSEGGVSLANSGFPSWR